MTEVKVIVTEELEKKSFRRLYLRLFFHVLFIAMYFYSSIVFLVHGVSLIVNEKVTNPAEALTMAKFGAGFATVWNFLLQSVFLTTSLVYDFMEWLGRDESPLGMKLKYFRDVLFQGLVLPMTLFITSMFWTIYWIDRELVFPQVYDQLVPWWFNHCVHTNITIVVLVETVLLARRHPTNFKLELWLTGGMGVLYAIVYYSIYFISHRWLYGVFGVMTWWQVCLFQILIWTSTFVFYFIQFPINRLFHRAESPDQKEVQETKTGMQNGAFSEESSRIPESWLKNRSKNQVESSSF